MCIHRYVLVCASTCNAACDQAKKRKAELQRRLGRSITLEGLESNIALCVVNPTHIDTTLADIGGLDDIAESLVRHVSSAVLRASVNACFAVAPPMAGLTLAVDKARFDL